MKRFLIALVAVLGCWGWFPAPSVAAAAKEPPSEGVTIHFFWAVSCPHCAEERPFLAELRKRYPGVVLREHEVWNNRANFELLVALAKSFGDSAVSTPATVVGGRLWFGFSPAIAEEIERTLKACLQQGCRDSISAEGKVLPGPSGDQAPGRQARSRRTVPPPLTLPLVGPVDPRGLSLPGLTVVIGLLDSFNPCAFFVLCFLLSLMIHAKSRRLMLLVGGTFVLFSGVIYFLFMAAWLNLFLLSGQLKAITALAGGGALLIGLLNIKDFFFFKQGVSLSIPQRAKPRLFERMRNLLKARKTAPVLFGTVVLALAANSYELLCTAGFPMVYTRLLTLRKMPSWSYYGYLAFYNVVYVLPLLAIVLIFTVSLGSRKLSEGGGRVLKLVSGQMMVLLGLVLLFDPVLMNDVFVALALVALALLFAALILVAERLWKAGRAQP